MKNIAYSRILMMSLMVVVTILGMGKVGQFLPEPAASVMRHEVRQDVAEPADAFATKQEETAAQKPPEALSQHWRDSVIPSVAAAEQMTLQEEVDTLSNSSKDALQLRRQHQALQAKEKELEQREALVGQAEKRAQDKIAELLQLEARIQAMLAEEESIKNKKIKRLTAVYEGMKAERAAPVIAQMDLDIVVRIFSRMSEKQVGKILSYLKPKQAVVISQALTRRIASVR